MAAAAASGDRRDTECSVCNEIFTEPKLLPCGHLLCRHCLLSWLISRQEDAKCPLCRSTLMDAHTRGSKSLEEYVDGLPTDLAMRNIADAERILSKDHQCCVCENVAATSLCLTCRDTFCQFCTKGHQKMSATKHHSVQSLASLTADTLAAASPSTCDAHADRFSEVFCTSHSVTICMVCATTDHRQCEVVRQETKMEEAYAEVREVIAVLSKGESEIDKAIQKLDDFQKKSKQLAETAINDAKHVYDSIDALVKKGRQQLTELEKANRADDGEEATQGVKTDLLNHKGRLTLHKQSAERVADIKSCADLNRMSSAVKARLGDLDYKAVLPQDPPISVEKQAMGSEAVLRVERSLQQQLKEISLIVSQFASQSPAFSFHSNHGPDVILSDDGKVAQKNGNSDLGGMVMSRQPMEIDHLYEIQVESLSNNVGKTRMLVLPGVVISSPDLLTASRITDCQSSAIYVTFSDTKIRGRKVKSPFGKQLLNFTEGSRLGVSLDAGRNLWLYRDGVLLDMVTFSVPKPAYALFDLRHPWIYSVAALPVTRLK